MHATPATARSYWPHILLLICNLIWAMDYPFYHILAPDYLHPMTLLTLSLLVTALLSLTPLIRQRAERVDPHDIPKLAAAALLIGVMRKGFLMFGLSRTSPIDGSIINTLGPLLILVLSVAIGIDRFTKLKVAGLALGLSGAIAVILWGGSASHEHSGLAGNLMILGGVAATAVYTVWFKKLLTKYRATTVLMWVYCIAAAVTLPFGIGPALHTDFSAWDTRAIVAFLFAMCFLTYLPNYLFNRARGEARRHGHLQLPAAHSGHRRVGRHGARPPACGYNLLRSADLHRHRARDRLLHPRTELAATKKGCPDSDSPITSKGIGGTTPLRQLR